MTGRKRTRDELREGIEDAGREVGRLVGKGVRKTGELIKRGAEKLDRALDDRPEERSAPPPAAAGPGPAARGSAPADDPLRKAVATADRGVRKLDGKLASDPELHRLVHETSDAIGRVIEKGAALAKRGIKKVVEEGEGDLEREKRRGRRS